MNDIYIVSKRFCTDKFSGIAQLVTVEGVWYPSKTFVDKDLKRWRKQRRILDVVYDHVENWDVAIDGGAFVGEWSLELAGRFDWVLAFEPVASNAECVRRNCHAEKVFVMPCALGKTCGVIRLSVNNALFAERTKAGAEGLPFPCLSIDSLGLSPAFIKLDLEGHDFDGLRGAKKTIERSHPVLCIETKYDDSMGGWLSERGYKMVHESYPDEVWVWTG